MVVSGHPGCGKISTTVAAGRRLLDTGDVKDLYVSDVQDTLSLTITQ